MATGTKICKICGAAYPFCKTPSKPGVFRWQDVACCEEHGKQYLAEILASRGEAPVVKTVRPPVVETIEVKEPEVVEDERKEVVEETTDVFTKRRKSRRKFIAAEEPEAETK